MLQTLEGRDAVLDKPRRGGSCRGRLCRGPGSLEAQPRHQHGGVRTIGRARRLHDIQETDGASDISRGTCLAR